MAVVVTVLLLAAYANTFRNGFHFDDDHAIVNNPWVRSLSFVPRYFVDATTFSVLPQNQNYRPVAQTTFALDYAIGGYRGAVFHVDTFVWFAALLATMFILARALTGDADQAFLAAALFGLHPAVADTVNYVVQRGEIIAALGVAGGLALFVARPSSRSTVLYLVPVVIGMLAKQTAIVFPFLLATYVWIYERRLLTRDVAVSTVVVGLVALWIAARTPASAVYASSSPVLYRLTQPAVALRYAAAFFAPVSLSVDYDWPLASSAGDAQVWIGVIFLIALMLAVWRLQRSASTATIAFGLAWFTIAQLPTAVVPLSEVANNWRMLLPFIGLAIAVSSVVVRPLRLAFERQSPPFLKGRAAAVVVLVLVVEAFGAHARNQVWRTDVSLWRDATMKSPQNARAWMNYGVALMGDGDYASAVDACERALVLAPAYTLVHVNLGVAYGGVDRQRDAEREFLTAQRLAPDDWRTHLYYARWLEGRGRTGEALRELDRARELNPAAVPLASTNQ